MASRSSAACCSVSTSGGARGARLAPCPLKRLIRGRAGYLQLQPGRGHAAALMT